MTVDEFLVGWLEKRIVPPSYFPADVPDLTPPVFVPK